MIALTGCGSVPAAGVGPVLSDPPASVVDALETAARLDSGAAAWVIGLDRFYEKQAVVTAR